MIYSGEIIGAAIVAVPLLFLAWGFLWRRHRPVFWFAVAITLVGVGYLVATGAALDIARIVVPNLVRA
jgi:drug/metabolite transporter (DMT)-like permease